ncbi:MAG: 2-oxo acid dehydrogenase subunit E2 [Bacillus sp. (in: Bacteria)]|nr:2-oxo acid dehydrogenase subunit E2 [Bacillus sp. (in: firmicutes)]
MVEFKLPDVGEGMHEGEIVNWLVKEGDRVSMDQPVVEIQTDKVTTELTAPIAGAIKKIFFEEGDVVEVGTTIFTILEEGSTEADQPMKVEPASQKVEKITAFKVNKDGRRGLATPFVRQRAREKGIDLDEVDGTGPAGRVTEADLQNYLNHQQTAKPVLEPNNSYVSESKKAVGAVPQEEERLLLKGIRKKIASHMTKSVSTIPHVTHVDEMHMGPLKELRTELKTYVEEKNIKLTYLPFFIKAIVIALKEFPFLNASIDEETQEIVLKRYYHIGIATDTKDGLLVPVIKHADKKSIFQLAKEINELARLAREGKLRPEQLTGSTFTISNVGPFGGLHATPIINYPEAAILALHKMEPRMVVRDWEGVVQLMMNMSLSFDHRMIDGVMAVRFTNRIKELLENPKLLLMELT